MDFILFDVYKGIIWIYKYVFRIFEELMKNKFLLLLGMCAEEQNALRDSI